MPKKIRKVNISETDAMRGLSVHAQQEIQKREAKIDQEVASRTATYDQDLKERARGYSINPDNFATQKELGEAIKIYEELNDIKLEEQEEL